jgi:hypothetical protein
MVSRNSGTVDSIGERLLDSGMGSWVIYCACITAAKLRKALPNSTDIKNIRVEETGLLIMTQA